MFISRQKINFIPHVFLEILERYANFLFWVLYAYLVMHTQKWLHKLMFTRIPKINYIIDFFLEILHRILQFDWLTVFWPITREPEFCQLWDWWRNINNKISFYFRLFPGKTNDKIFQKIQNILFWDHFGPFLLKFTQKMNFPGKKDSVSF